jgi:hypothetical protein
MVNLSGVGRCREILTPVNIISGLTTEIFPEMDYREKKACVKIEGMDIMSKRQWLSSLLMKTAYHTLPAGTHGGCLWNCFGKSN